LYPILTNKKSNLTKISKYNISLLSHQLTNFFSKKSISPPCNSNQTKKLVTINNFSHWFCGLVWLSLLDARILHKFYPDLDPKQQNSFLHLNVKFKIYIIQFGKNGFHQYLSFFTKSNMINDFSWNLASLICVEGTN
jgi:hypothetical protein